jgi:hypothetical protein
VFDKSKGQDELGSFSDVDYGLRITAAGYRVSSRRTRLESLNPRSLKALKTTSQINTVFPEVAIAWCWLVGFDRAHVLFPNGAGDVEKDRATQGEYAVVATKSATD